jgi:hypothetical protein
VTVSDPLPNCPAAVHAPVTAVPLVVCTVKEPLTPIPCSSPPPLVQRTRSRGSGRSYSRRY